MLPPPDAPNGSLLLQAANNELVIFIGLSVLVAFLLYLFFVGRWMYRDAKLRGLNAPLWVTIFLLGSLPGFAVVGLIVVIAYLVVRASRKVTHTDQGHLYVPNQPPPAVPPIMAPIPANPSLPAGRPLPAGVPAARPLPSGPLPRVKCPYCQHIFPYQRAFEGPTHVKCPACGQEGNI